MDAGSAADGRARDGPTARQNGVFFGLTLAVFLLTRLWGLERFPIFFFCDEAVQTVQAARLWEHGMRDDRGVLLPTYLRNTEFYNLSVGVYLQLLPERVLPRSVFVARAVPLAVLFSAMLAVGLILRDFLRLRFWWVGVLVLSGFPGWFLHTRIAFELMLATGFYVWFLYFYLRYRDGRPRALYAAAVFGALTFYGYNTFQPVIVATALVLAAADARYHWRNRGTVARTLLLLVLLALPYVRFLRGHAGEVSGRLRSLDSYWTDPARTLPGKLAAYATEYVRAFSPRYWFFPDPPGDIGRHTMRGYGHVPLAALPFVVGGIVLCARHVRRPAERTLLVALAAAPVGGALVRSGITRAMTLVVVFGMLAGVAADPLLRLASRWIRPAVVGAVVLLGLAGVEAAMLADALRNGPTWYRDYGLYGMQWGAREVFAEVGRIRKAHPQALIVLTPVWANGVDDLVDFFLRGHEHIVIANVDWLRSARRDIPEETLAVMTEDEYRSADGGPRFADMRVEKTLDFPDGRPGFRFVWLRYAADFDAVLARERESWHRLVEEDVVIGGETAKVSHSVFAPGQEARHLFDGDDRSLVRTEKANPAVVVVEFPRPRPLRHLSLTTGSMDMEITVDVAGPSGNGLLRAHVPRAAARPDGRDRPALRSGETSRACGSRCATSTRRSRRACTCARCGCAEGEAPGLQRRKSERLQESTRFCPRSETTRRPNGSSAIPVGDLRPSALYDFCRFPAASYWAIRPFQASVTNTVSDGPTARYGSV